MMFGKEYRDLADMLLNNERAKKFYRDLSKDVQQTITENGQENFTHTPKELIEL